MKHKWHKEIINWANGAQIQVRPIDWGEADWVNDKYPTWDKAYYEYRVKPTTIKYRVALMRCGETASTTTSMGAASAMYVENTENFIRWLTDWQEVEI